MALAYITRAQVRQDITERLGDTDNIHWTEDEINFHINEALYTFGALANYWKETIALASVQDQVYYDLSGPDVIPTGKLDFNLTAQYVVDGINYALLESLSDAAPIGQFITLDEVLGTLKDKITEMQLAAGLVLSHIDINVPGPPIQIVPLPDNVIDILRVQYKNDSNVYYVLKRDSEAYIEITDPNYNDLTRNPKYYADTLNDSNQQLLLYPPTSVDGLLELIVVTAPTVATSTTADIDFPDNLVPYLKWGILAVILNKDGELNDPNRAAYAAQRWLEGLFIAKNYTSVLKGYVNGRPVGLDSIDNIDNMNNKWRNQVATDKASMLAVAGYNMVMPNRVPSANTQGWSFVSVVNAPVLTDDSEFLQIKNEYLNSFTNYVYHLLLFKDGISDLKRTQSYLEGFLKDALQYNTRLVERGIGYKNLLEETKNQELALGKIEIDTPYQG